MAFFVEEQPEPFPALEYVRFSKNEEDEELFHLELEENGGDILNLFRLERTPGQSPPTKRAALLESESPISESHIEESPERGDIYEVDTFFWKVHLQDRYYGSAYGQLPESTDITLEMRAILLDWLVAVYKELEYSTETWCLAVNVMDRYLSIQPLDKECLQLVGLTALMIAAKQEEIQPPSLSVLVSLCANSYEIKHFLMMEAIILYALGFELMVPTPSFFVNFYVAECDTPYGWPHWLSNRLLEKALCHSKLYATLPSILADHIVTVVLQNIEQLCGNLNPERAMKLVDRHFEALAHSLKMPHNTLKMKLLPA